MTRELREETGIHALDLTFAAVAEFDVTKPEKHCEFPHDRAMDQLDRAWRKWFEELVGWKNIGPWPFRVPCT